MSQSIPTWCWYCKQEIPAAAEVCPYCGKPLNDATKVVRCGKCGKFLLKNTPHCTQCGEPTPQPEPPAAPVEPPAQDAEAGAPPAGSSTQDAEALGTPETMRMFEELELLSARKKQSGAAVGAAGKKNGRSTILSAVLLLLVGAGIIFGVWRIRIDRSNRPVYCAEDKHQWIEADCKTPKICALCGKTEGERLGHKFEENVCTVCGEYERLFYFTEFESQRSGGEVVFRGSVKNFTDAEVQSLQIKVQLYDANKELVETLPGTAIENAGLAPFESAEWQIRYNDSSVKWKYWRVYVEDYGPKA